MGNVELLNKIKEMLDNIDNIDVSQELFSGSAEESDVIDDITVSITRLREKKEKLKYENEYIRNLIEMTDEGVLTVSEENKIIFMNRAFIRIFGLEETCFDDRCLRDVEVFRPIEEMIENCQEKFIKEKEININGRKLIISVKVKTMKGNLKDKIVMIRDITEESKLRDIIFETKKIMALGDLASGIAHEIRNPLTPIRGLLQIIKNNLAGKSESFDNYMNIIFSEIDKINGKIENLNKFAEKEEYRKEEVEIDKIITDVTEALKGQIYFSAKEIKLNINLNDGNEKIYLNEDKIKEAIANILKNSCEAIEYKGQIDISTKIEDKKLTIDISDNGRGIPKKNLKNVINPFYTTKSGNKSMGLGLSITYKIINDHNGGLFIDSEEGKGTSVKIIFYV